MQSALESKEVQIKFESESLKKRELGRLKYSWEKNIKLTFGKIVYELDSSGSGQGQVAGSCENGFESCSMNCGEYIDNLSDYQLLKKHSALEKLVHVYIVCCTEQQTDLLFTACN